MRGNVTRRGFLGTLGALALTPRGQAQGVAPIPLRAINHMTIRVSDPTRSLEWYQGLFGFSIAARQGATPVLRLGDGPQFIAIAGSRGGATGIHHICFTVDDFDVDGLMRILGEHGITRSETPGPMRARVRMRGQEFGGAPEGTPELYFQDPAGLTIQIQDGAYCGGAGVLGERCLPTAEPAPTPGRLTVRDYNHFTIFVSDPGPTLQLYEALFGLPRWDRRQVFSLRLPSGQYVGVTGAGQAPRFHHACFNVDDFDPDRILDVLEGYGVTRRADGASRVGPLTSYVVTRTDEQGGAVDGTPEIYFTDPDGIVIQLQDARYCGGAGYLGDVCV